MKKLLIMTLALFSLTGAYAQEGEEGEVVLPVFTKSLNSLIEDAKFIVADAHYTKGQATLQNAINAAEAQMPTLADNESVRQEMITLQAAIDEFVFGNDYADATELVQNPSFSIDGNNSKTITSWTVKNFKQNRRDAATYETTRSGYTIHYFAEQWIASPNKLTNGDISQVLTKLPAGHYRMTADCFVHYQKYDDTCEEAVGVELYANNVVREVGQTGFSDSEAAAFSLDFDVAEGEEVTIGFRYNDANYNWLGWDNVTLLFIGDPQVYNDYVYAEKYAAAIEALNASLTAAKEALASEDAPFYRNELQTAIDVATAKLEATDLDELAEAKEALDAVVASFKDYNKHYTALKAAIEAAEALLATDGMTNGTEQFQEAINTAKAQMASAAADYANDAEGGVALTDAAVATLKQAESVFRVLNACYAHPANVITNGSMANTDGWEILVPGSNPGLHINTSGNVTNFSTPFMECWVNNTNYGQENYARQTVNALPSGQELPSGYYVLKAACLATRQDQPDLKVSGVTLRFEDQQAEVQTANGVANIYNLGYLKEQAGGELTIGLYIDENTDANWIAWDEVELQFVGDKDKYIEDYTKAVLGESLAELKKTLDDVLLAIEDVDMNGVDFETTDLYWAIDEANDILSHPTEFTKEEVLMAIQNLNESLSLFYASGVSPKEGKTFNFTKLIKNADFDLEPAGEWTVEVENGTLPSGTDCAYWWFGGSTGLNLIQDFSQTLMGMPAGNYLLEVNAAVRVDMNYSTDGYTAENLPNNLTSCKFYANNDSCDVHPFFYEDEEKGLTLAKMLDMTNDWDYRHGNGTLIDYMLKESGYFITALPFKLDEQGDIKIGFRVELPKLAGQMPFIDYFHLNFYGNQDPTAITSLTSSETQAPAGIYNLKGQLVSRDNNVKGLAKGLYITNGRMIVIK